MCPAWPRLVLASLTTLATCGPTSSDDREHLTGFATEECIDAIEGLSHGLHDPSLDVLLTRDGDTIILELESTELRPSEDDPTAPTHPVPCTHHYELAPTD